MSSRRFRELEQLLVQEGAAPRYVKRVIRELDDHASDLVNGLVEQGMTKGEAELQARKKIGDDKALAEEILSQPFARSLVARYPYVVFTLGPFALGAAIFASTLLLFIGFVTWGKSKFEWSQTVLGTILIPHHFFSSYVLVPGLAVFFIWLAHTRNCSLSWAFGSVAILALLGSLLFETALVFPSKSSGEAHYSATFYWNGYVYSYWRLFAPLLIFVGYAGWLKLRETPTT